MDYPTCHLYFTGRIYTCLYRENTSDSWDILWYTIRKRYMVHNWYTAFTFLMLP